MAKSTYDYILYKADGTKVNIGSNVKKKEWQELKDILNAHLLEIVPKEYVDEAIDQDFDMRATYYMDEEARLKDETNVRNNWFKVIESQPIESNDDPFSEDFEIITVGVPTNERGLLEYDIVGDVLMEKKHK